MGYNCNPLEAAIRKNDAQGALRLIAARQFIRARDRKGHTALHRAAGRGRVAVVEALIAAGADIGAATTGGETPLGAAVVSGHTEVVRQLLAAGADARRRDNLLQGSPPTCSETESCADFGKRGTEVPGSLRALTKIRARFHSEKPYRNGRSRYAK